MRPPHDHAAQEFGFDTVFDAAGGVAYAPPNIKRSYSVEEVEQIRAASYAEGQRAATVRAEEAQAAALANIGRAARDALGVLAETAHNHRAGATELALATAKVIAGAALDVSPRPR